MINLKKLSPIVVCLIVSTILVFFINSVWPSAWTATQYFRIGHVASQKLESYQSTIARITFHSTIETVKSKVSEVSGISVPNFKVKGSKVDDETIRVVVEANTQEVARLASYALIEELVNQHNHDIDVLYSSTKAEWGRYFYEVLESVPEEHSTMETSNIHSKPSVTLPLFSHYSSRSHQLFAEPSLKSPFLLTKASLIVLSFFVGGLLYLLIEILYRKKSDSK